MSGLLFADDFVGIAETGRALQSLIDIVYNYSKRWRFEADVKKCAVVIFSKTGRGSDKWVWGDESLPILDSYCYLGVEFNSGGPWDKHIKTLIMRNRQKLGGLYRVLHNFSLDLEPVDTFLWLCCDLVWNMAVRCGTQANSRLKL